MDLSGLKRHLDFVGDFLDTSGHFAMVLVQLLNALLHSEALLVTRLCLALSLDAWVDEWMDG